MSVNERRHLAESSELQTRRPPYIGQTGEERGGPAGMAVGGPAAQTLQGVEPKQAVGLCGGRRITVTNGGVTGHRTRHPGGVDAGGTRPNANGGRGLKDDCVYLVGSVASA